MKAVAVASAASATEVQLLLEEAVVAARSAVEAGLSQVCVGSGLHEKSPSLVSARPALAQADLGHAAAGRWGSSNSCGSSISKCCSGDEKDRAKCITDLEIQLCQESLSLKAEAKILAEIRQLKNKNA